MSLFSVIIPLYNRAEYIGRALKSVLDQTFTDYELIVVDDGSTDNGAEVVKGFGERVVLIQQANQGAGPARNAGIARASGQYVAFLDSDDVWYPWTLATYARLISQHHSPSILSGSVVDFTGQAPPPITEGALQADYYDDFLAARGAVPGVGSGQAVIRRDDLLKAGAFAGGNINAEDHDLILRLGTAPGLVIVKSPIVLGCLRHAGGVSRQPLKSFDGMLHLVAQERAGKYPGGEERKSFRTALLAANLRATSLTLLDTGYRPQAWRLYREGLAWQIRHGRVRYLLGFLLRALRTRGVAVKD